MVYVLNSQHCNSGYELAKKRNILFTAITRSKAWVRICGYGPEMNELEQEFKLIKKNDFKLKFKYPTIEERERLRVVNRDMTNREKHSLKKKKRYIDNFAEQIRIGNISIEDLPDDMKNSIKNN